MKFEWKINFNEELFDKIIGFRDSNDGSVECKLMSHNKMYAEVYWKKFFVKTQMMKVFEFMTLTSC